MTYFFRRSARRLAWAALVAWFAMSLTFVLSRSLPDDPRRDEQNQICRDQALPAAYACFARHSLRGDFGTSLATGEEVPTILARGLGPTLELVLMALFLEALLGIGLGAVAAVRGGWTAHLLDATAVLLQSVPVFVIAPIVFSLAAFRVSSNIALPALSLALGKIGFQLLLSRGELRTTLGSGFAKAARAKGISAGALVFRHALPVAAGPLLGVLAVDLAELFSMSAVVEWVFGWPGLGREAVRAALDLNTPVLLGVVWLTSIVVALGGWVADSLHLLLDPRTRSSDT